MIGKEIVLTSDLYVIKYANDSVLSVSKNNFRLEGGKSVLLSKGDTIKIVAFARKDFFLDNIISRSGYDIGLQASMNRHIYNLFGTDTLEVDHQKETFYVFSNNFFYELDMLDDQIIRDYNMIPNDLFRPLYLLYPFALFYLLQQVFKSRMDTIRNNYGFHPFSIVVYTVAYYYVLLAAINDGFSSFYLGIPYMIFLLWEIIVLKKHNKIKYLHTLILATAVLLIVSDRSRSQLLYPMVGKTYTVVNDTNYSYDGLFYINEIDIFEMPSSSGQSQQLFSLEPGDRFRIERQMVTGHPDFGISYTYEIQAEKFSELKTYISSNLSEIKVKLYEQYFKNFHQEKTEIYFEDKNKFYISDFDLRQLLKMQKLPYKEHNIENTVAFFGFFIFFYPVILALFYLVLMYRNKDTIEEESQQIRAYQSKPTSGF